MIKFEFTVDDVDAETIMNCMQERVAQCEVWILNYLCDDNLSKTEKDSKIQWCKEHKKYLQELMKKMKNTRA